MTLAEAPRWHHPGTQMVCGAASAVSLLGWGIPPLSHVGSQVLALPPLPPHYGTCPCCRHR